VLNILASQANIKQKIREFKSKSHMTIKDVSLKTGINQFCLINTIYNPFFKVKMTYGLVLMKALNFKISDLF
jgi:hypothetical protein